MNRRIALVIFGLLACFFSLSAQSIEEKRAALSGGAVSVDQSIAEPLNAFREQYDELRGRVAALRAEAWLLQSSGADPDEVNERLQLIMDIQDEIRTMQEQWRMDSAERSAAEAYALWHQPEVSIEQLVTDYGALERVYLMPEDVAKIKISLASNLPVPRGNWEEMLTLILAESGIGFHEPSPLLRVLFKQDDAPYQVSNLLSDRTQLDLVPDERRIAYLLEVDPQESQRTYHLLTKLTGPQHASLHLVANSVLIVGTVPIVREILKLHDYIAQKQGVRTYRLYPLRRGTPEDMVELLHVIFAQDSQQHEASEKRDERTPFIDKSFVVMSLKNLPQTLFLLGTPDQLQRAEDILKDLENQIGDEQEKQLFWYTCKHSNAEDLAEVLDRVYRVMLGENIQSDAPSSTMSGGSNADGSRRQDEGAYKDGISITVQPPRVDPSRSETTDTLSNRENFVVDQKTGSIIMVLDPLNLERIKGLIKKLDVPKKMVRIDVIVFEKRFTDQVNYGLNLLQVGASAVADDAGAANVNDTRGFFDGSGDNRGILDFILRRTGGKGWPAFDIGYQFLMTQDDVTINANPSITTINQTKATISIVQEQSVSTGRQIEDTSSGAVNTEGFSRAQFGITIEITPTIHAASEHGDWDGFEDYVTLDTTLTFDTITVPGERPEVGRRNLTNLVRIQDGETIILGGLRQRDSTEGSAKLPFLGDIPGLGKLFGQTGMRDVTTETFIMLTPTIIHDPAADLDRQKRIELAKRPGDLPEFLHLLRKAEEREHQRLMRQSMSILFGRQIPKTRPLEAYDGR